MRLGIVITVKDRPEYTAQCFDYLKRAKLPEGTRFDIVDDYSKEEQKLKKIYNDFVHTYCTVGQVNVLMQDKTYGIKESLKEGIRIAFLEGCDLICILDNDAIINNEAFNWLIYYHKKYPKQIVTGFNCNTKNKNGTVRHEIVEERQGLNFKNQ